ncbi:hypothetical protein HKX48_001989 [Thoreauomyces humboldtii]|nr:hypothetical protein HKX48_001989 [Thoreauomyces humboldtii]
MSSPHLPGPSSPARSANSANSQQQQSFSSGPGPQRRLTLRERATAFAATAARHVLATLATLPSGTVFVLLLCLGLHILSYPFSFLGNAGCLAANAYISSPISNVLKLLSNHFLHVGWWHLIMNSMAWPSFAVPLEQELGTYQFMHVILLLSLVSSFIYVLVGAFFGLMITQFGAACSEGLSALIFALLTIEASHARGLFERLQ